MDIETALAELTEHGDTVKHLADLIADLARELEDGEVAA